MISAQTYIDASNGRKIINLPECICRARLTINEALLLLDEMERLDK